MKKLLVICVLFLIPASYSQNLFFGIPLKIENVKSGDIIIINEINWQNSFGNFSEIGYQQLEQLINFISRKDSNFQLKVHSFYNRENSIMDYDISELISKKIYEIIKERNSELVKRIEIIACGNKEPFFCGNENIMYKEFLFNNRIEIIVK